MTYLLFLLGLVGLELSALQIVACRHMTAYENNVALIGLVISLCYTLGSQGFLMFKPPPLKPHWLKQRGSRDWTGVA